jgi:membrane associated rhomboid family serine protease
MRHVRFILFYCVVRFAAALAHLALNSSSMVPTIGASWAVSGILGAHLVLFPHARVKTLVNLGWSLTTVYFPV